MLVLCIILVLCLLTLLFFYLIKQSKKPQGLPGRIMMRIWNQTYGPLVEWALIYIPPGSVSHILDVGVGNGGSTVQLKERFPEAEIYGIDVSEDAIAAAEKQRPTSLMFSVQAIEKTTFKNEQFELITAFQTHFHWDDLDAAFKEIHRLLVPGGVVLIACEQSKIRYYLKELSNNDSFNSYLMVKGFKLEAAPERNGYQLYIIRKVLDS